MPDTDICTVLAAALNLTASLLRTITAGRQRRSARHRGTRRQK